MTEEDAAGDAPTVTRAYVGWGKNPIQKLALFQSSRLKTHTSLILLANKKMQAVRASSQCETVS